MGKLKKIRKIILINLTISSILIFYFNAVAWQRLGKISVEKYMKMIEDAFYKHATREEINRKIAYKTEDWPAHVNSFVRVEKDGLPIMGSTGFVSSRKGTLEVEGITKKSEILQFLEKKRIISIPNPLSRKPDSSGIWYKVRMLSGAEGWLFVKPESKGTFFASYFKKKAVTQPKPAPKTKSSGSKLFADEDLRYIKTGLIILAVLILFIVIVSKVSKKKSPASRPSSYSSSHSSGHSYSSSSPSEAGRQTLSKNVESRSKEKPEADWPWKGKQVIIENSKIKERGLVDFKVGHTKEIWGETEVRKEGIFGSDKVGVVKRDPLGEPKSIVDKKGNKIGDIKWMPFGPDVIVDKNGKKIGEYKEGDKSSDDDKTSSGCYLATACHISMGLNDGCHELFILRNFRDKFLLKTEQGKKEVMEYYQIAPKIIDAINKEENAKKIWSLIYTDIKKAVSLILNNEFDKAIKLYQNMTFKLKKKYLN